MQEALQAKRTSKLPGKLMIILQCNELDRQESRHLYFISSLNIYHLPCPITVTLCWKSTPPKKIILAFYSFFKSYLGYFNLRAILNSLDFTHRDFSFCLEIILFPRAPMQDAGGSPFSWNLRNQLIESIFFVFIKTQHHISVVASPRLAESHQLS